MPNARPAPRKQFDLARLKGRLTKRFSNLPSRAPKNATPESGDDRKWLSVDIAAFLAVVAAALVIYVVALPRDDGTLFGSYSMRMKPLNTAPADPAIVAPPPGQKQSGN